jgi:hypothetical protein
MRERGIGKRRNGKCVWLESLRRRYLSLGRPKCRVEDNIKMGLI